MKAVRVLNIFGCDWRRDYRGHEHEFLYNGFEYLPLDVVKDKGYLIRDCNIEEIDYEN